MFPDAELLLGLVAALGVVYLSFQEQRRSIRPSTLILSYLTASSLCDTIWLTLPPLSGAHPLRALQLFLKLTLLVLESQGKESILLEEYRGLPPEEYSSILGTAFFWWINGLLAQGYNRMLGSDNQLPPIDRKLNSSGLRRDVLKAWDGRGL